MYKRRNILGLIFALTLLIQSSVVTSAVAGQTIREGRSKTRKGSWSALVNRTVVTMGDSLPDGNQDDSVAARGVEPQEAVDKQKIVGTWLIRVPDAPDAPGFSALQTFHDGGTFTETSDLLGSLVEGPAHGAYTGKKNDYRLTFELFSFDENGQPAGRVRVRVTVHLINDNQLQATATVDIIEPNGNVIPAVATSPYTGTRVQVLPE